MYFTKWLVLLTVIFFKILHIKHHIFFNEFPKAATICFKPNLFHAFLKWSIIHTVRIWRPHFFHLEVKIFFISNLPNLQSLRDIFYIEFRGNVDLIRNPGIECIASYVTRETYNMYDRWQKTNFCLKHHHLNGLLELWYNQDVFDIGHFCTKFLVFVWIICLLCAVSGSTFTCRSNRFTL